MTEVDSIVEPDGPVKAKSEAAEGFWPGEGEIHKAHWHLFVPTIVIALLYLTGYLVIIVLGRGDGALGKVFSLVLFVGVPLLAAHAILRYNTSRVQLAEDHVRYHRGWPDRLPVDLPYALIDTATVKRGLSGRLFGGGTLVMLLTTGSKIAVPDLKDPDQIQVLLNRRLSPGKEVESVENTIP